ncbi:hypothetical protein E5671_33280 [Streptomyces sp. BA2]|nr:hypothetical protein [Streptomyces sp. BA2]MWA13996.1 hypothetical protein [Streptomyces sp. BA2]
MGWDEWEQLKAGAAERHSEQMQLNEAPTDKGDSDPGNSGGWGNDDSGNLKSSKAAWAKAGEGVGSLRENIGKALTKLEEGQGGLDKSSGCLSAAAQRDVHITWERYVKDVSGRCEDLQKLMVQMGRLQRRTDEGVEAELAKLATEHQDTSAIGGQTKGR